MAMANDIREFTNKLQDGFYKKKILVEGDSWASHPFPSVTNLAAQIDSFSPNKYMILNLADPGDEASAIFKAHGKQMKKLKQLLNTAQWGDTFDLILLSAAGNDIVGPEIVGKGYVKNKRDFPNLYGRELLTDGFYNAVSEVVKGYSRFLNMRDSTSLNKSTPVITHVYSYLTPREVGTHIGRLKFTKGWIKRHLKHQGITNAEEQYEIACEMLDAFFRRISAIQSNHENFLVVDTRTVLSKDGSPDMSLWFDEIHPNKKGFKLLAEHIRDAAEHRGLWKI